MVATQKEDRRRVEKALEAVGLNAGKVALQFSFKLMTKICL